MKKYSFIVLKVILVFSCLQATGQVSSANWKAHFAYLNFVDIAVSEENIYIAAENSVFIHNVETNSNIEYTTIDGLSGEDISVIHYSEAYSSIIVGYANGLVEIINENSGQVRSLVDISAQSDTYPIDSITINNFFEEGELLYIATGFGVVQYNLETSFFEDTFLISDSSAVVSDITAVGVFEDVILASITGRGTFAADRTNFNLISESSWINIQPDVFTDIILLGSKLIAHQSTTDIYSYDGSLFSSEYVSNSRIIDFKVNSNNELTITHETGSIILDSNFEEQLSLEHGNELESNLVVNTSVFFNEELYFSNVGNGFNKTNDLNFAESVIISPDGPVLNGASSIDVYEGEIWLTFGEVSSTFTVNSVTRTGVSRRNNDNWTNFSFDEVLGAADITDVIIDRNKSDHTYLSAFFGGLLEYTNGEFVLYDSENSNIEDDFDQVTLPDFNLVFIDKVFTSTIDMNGDVWISNNRSLNPIKKFSNDGNGTVIDYSPIIDPSASNFSTFNLNFNELILDEDLNIYAASNTQGLVMYNPDTNLIFSFNDISNNIPTPEVTDLVLDKNGELWIGTFRGIRKITNPNLVFNSRSLEAESIIFLEDGIAQELLFEQSITDIKVDASNNKWISTSDGGVFYVTPDGQETIYNFTSSNSPLPSNTVNDIAIDDSTGAVFFATNRGLVEFNSSVVNAEEDLKRVKVFPNPVRPEYENPIITIEGLTAGANVKITDIEGNLIYEIQNETFESGGSGSVQWDTKSFRGNKVSSGVYLILITDEEGVETTVEKLLIVR